MNQEEKDKFNTWLGEISWLAIENKIHEVEDSFYLEGSFIVPIKEDGKEDLKFTIHVPKNYPNNNINFFCTNFDGFDHQMPSGLICHNPDVYFHKEAKFKHEFQKLNSWIEKFYIKEETSEHYEHLMFSDRSNQKMLFDDVDIEAIKDKKFGYFHHAQVNEQIYKNGNKIHTYIATKIGDQQASISTNFKEFGIPFSQQVRQGIWFYSSDKPVLYRRKTIDKWDDLLSLLTEEQIDFLYSFKKRNRRIKGIYSRFFILFGYRIKNTETGETEIHWELIEDHVKLSDQELRSLDDKKLKKIQRNELVKWGKTKKISPSNFFGRGAFSTKFINSRILVIGIGAIGSSLSKSLTRGGAKCIDLIDPDRVEVGNICRSEYNFFDIHKYKVNALKDTLIKISPFVEVNVYPKIFVSKTGSSSFEKQREILQRYDIIFDCTTDKYLSNILDQMQLPGRIINLSITNKAEDLVCITGSGNITAQKAKVYSKLNKKEDQEPFYPEVGCFHPTFQASYNDINLLLNTALKEINYKILREVGLRNFIVNYRQDMDGLSIDLKYDI